MPRQSELDGARAAPRNAPASSARIRWQRLEYVAPKFPATTRNRGMRLGRARIHGACRRLHRRYRRDQFQSSPDFRQGRDGGRGPVALQAGHARRQARRAARRGSHQVLGRIDGRAPRTTFLIVENDTKYALWLQHTVAAGWPADSIVIMDWTSFGRVRTAMTVRDYDIVMLALEFDEGIEEPTTDSFDWIRKLRSQPGFPEMIILADGGSELAAIRTLRLGAADYLPKRLLTPPRLQRSIKLTLRAIEKEAQRRAERQALAAPARPKPTNTPKASPVGESDARPVFAYLHAHGRQPGRAASQLATPVISSTARLGGGRPRITPVIRRTSPRTPAPSLAEAAKAALAAHPSRPAGAIGRAAACRSRCGVVARAGAEVKPVAPRESPDSRSTPSCRRSASPKPPRCISPSPRTSATTWRSRFHKRKHSAGDAGHRHRPALDHVPARVRSHRRARPSVHHRPVRLRHPRGRRIPRDGIFPLRRPQGAPAEPADGATRPSRSSRKSRCRSRWCTRPASSIAT